VMAATRQAVAQFLADFPGARGRLEVREHRREKFLAMGSSLS
jgi:acetyl-CoA carboxylase carboxyl transferase subunit alpha